MFRSHIANSAPVNQLSRQYSKSKNSLGIGNPSFIWDQKRKQLVLIMDINQMIGNDISAHVKGNRLILEAPLISSYNKPYRTHIPGQKYRDEFEDGFTVIGFSEVKLKYGYQYHLISCQAIEPNMIKVILGFSFWGKNGNN